MSKEFIRFAGPAFSYRQRWTPILCRPGIDDPFPEHGSHQRHAAWVFDRTPQSKIDLDEDGSHDGVLKVLDFPQHIFDKILEWEHMHGYMCFGSKGTMWTMRSATVSGKPTMILIALEDPSPFTDAELLTLRQVGKRWEVKQRLLARMQTVRGPHSAQEIQERMKSLEVAV